MKPCPSGERATDVWDRPGMGIEFNLEAAKAYLPEADRAFFD